MGASRREILRGDVVLVDLGLNKAGYHGDMARCYAVGEVSDEIWRLAGICRELEDVGIAAIRPGVTAGSVYDATLEAARRLGSRTSSRAAARTSAMRSGSSSTSRPCSVRASRRRCRRG